MKRSLSKTPNGAVLDCVETSLELWWIDVCTRQPLTNAPRLVSRSTLRNTPARTTRSRAWRSRTVVNEFEPINDLAGTPG